MIPLIMGGLSLAQGVFGALGASSQAKAQAMAQEIQQRNANFQRQWQTEAQNRNQMRQFQAALERNIQVEKAANKEKALAELYLDRNFNNQKSTLSKQTAQVNAQFSSTMTGRGISATSGTARALMRQNMESLGNNLVAMKTNYNNAYRDLTSQQSARLAQRVDTMFPAQTTFIPQTGGIMDASSSALTTGLISAGMGAVAQGVSSYFQYGWGGGGDTGGGFMPFAERGGGE